MGVVSDLWLLSICMTQDVHKANAPDEVAPIDRNKQGVLAVVRWGTGRVVGHSELSQSHLPGCSPTEWQA